MICNAGIRLIEVYEPNAFITNANAEEDLTIYLPQPFTGRQYQVLQLSGFEIVLHTNSEETFFLTSKRAKKLRLEGSPDTIGKCLTIESYLGKWRVSSSTFNDSQLTFEE